MLLNSALSMDSALSMAAQVSMVAKSAFGQLNSDLATVTCVLIASRFDYCNALYIGLTLESASADSKSCSQIVDQGWL